MLAHFLSSSVYLKTAKMTAFDDTPYGRVFTSDFSGRLASDNRKSRENSYFSDSLKVK